MPDVKQHKIVTLTQISDLVSEATRMTALDAGTNRVTQPLYAAEQMIAELRENLSANGDTRDETDSNNQRRIENYPQTS